MMGGSTWAIAKLLLSSKAEAALRNIIIILFFAN
jgi:hypothetical protein